MGITTTLPSTVRRPLISHEFDLTSSAQALVPLTNRALLIGIQGGAATATADVAQQVFDELTSDVLFEAGSEIALMVRKALEAGRALGLQPEIWAAGIADPAGTAATHTFSISGGPASAAGDHVIRIGDVPLRIGVSAADTDTVVAAAYVDAIDALAAELPCTAANVAGVVTLTMTDTGVNGNALELFVDDVGLTGQAVAIALSVIPGVGNAVIATALSNSLSRFYETTAIANHLAADITALQTHLDTGWLFDEKRWTFGVMAETGTLATANTLSTTADDHRIVIGSYEGSGTLPGQIAAAIAVEVSARAQPNYNWDGQEIPIGIPPDADVYTTAEVESALAAGSTPLRPNDKRTKSTIVRLITTKTTENSAPFERAKDLSTIRGLVYSARQIDATYLTQFQALNKSQQVVKRVRSVTFGVLKALEDEGVLEDVDKLFKQLLTESDTIVKTRLNVTSPESVVQNLHQIVTKHVLFVR